MLHDPHSNLYDKGIVNSLNFQMKELKPTEVKHLAQQQYNITSLDWKADLSACVL